MNKIERATMTVTVNGTKEIRQISHYEMDEMVEIGQSIGRAMRRPIPMMSGAERCMHTISGDVHVYRVDGWPDPRSGQLGRSVPKTEVQDEDD